MHISEETTRLLGPLQEFRSPYDQQHGKFHFSNNGYPKLSHSDFVVTHVLPVLKETCPDKTPEVLAKEIVDLLLPFYLRETSKIGTVYETPEDALYGTEAFLSNTLLCNRTDDGNISPHLTNLRLVDRFGLPYVFGPIMDLAFAHSEYKVFNVTKFFNHHACRMGEVIGNFSQGDYLAYIKLAKKLLEKGVYDWSIEQSPEEWGTLTPLIKAYGLEAVLAPMVQAMVDIAHLPGTKGLKYNYSLLSRSIKALYPIILPRARKNGVEEISLMLKPVVDYILKLGERGRFNRGHQNSEYHMEELFFNAFTKDISLITTIGIPNYMRDHAVRW